MFQNDDGSSAGSGSRAYDPLTGSFLTLQWRDIFSGGGGAMALVEDPLSRLLLYRYPRNDPINAKFNPFHRAAGKC